MTGQVKVVEEIISEESELSGIPKEEGRNGMGAGGWKEGCY